MEIKFQGTAAIVNDLHKPFHDPRVLTEVMLFLKEKQLGLVIIAGDVGDFYLLSKFDKNPRRAETLQDDLNSVKWFHKELRGILPNTRIIEEEGNHEDRLR